VLYNQLAGLYNDAVQASRAWLQAYSSLQEALGQLPDVQEREFWTSRLADPQSLLTLVIGQANVPASLFASLRDAQGSYRLWQEAQQNYHNALQRFPVSALARAFKFAPLS